MLTGKFYASLIKYLLTFGGNPIDNTSYWNYYKLFDKRYFFIPYQNWIPESMPLHFCLMIHVCLITGLRRNSTGFWADNNFLYLCCIVALIVIWFMCLHYRSLSSYSVDACQTGRRPFSELSMWTVLIGTGVSQIVSHLISMQTRTFYRDRK